MKKNSTFVIAIMMFALLSCKKDRTCECTSSIVSDTSTQPNYNPYPYTPSKTSTKYSKVKKSNVVIESCVTSEDTQTYTNTVYTGTATVNYQVTRVTKNECSIK